MINAWAVAIIFIIMGWAMIEDCMVRSTSVMEQAQKALLGAGTLLMGTTLLGMKIVGWLLGVVF